MGLITVKATEDNRSRLIKSRPFLHVWIGRTGEDSGPAIIVRILRRYGLNLSIKDIRYGLYGKPESEKTSPFRFNMTNDEGIFLFAVTDYGEIGVDLQGTIDKERRKQALEAVFTLDELEVMSRDSLGLPVSIYWAIKEAMVKQEGSSIWFGKDLRIAGQIDNESKGHWISLEDHWIYAVLRRNRGFALALSGDRLPPDPEYLIEVSG